MIITANKFFRASWNTYTLEFARGMYMKGLVYSGLIDESAEPLKAYVNHGRWLVKCECGGAEKAWEEGLFMCQSCWNAGHRHKLRRVIFSDDRVEIEHLLEVRPLPNRNWYPYETVADLRDENKVHEDLLLEVR